jgi:hypothetical protein
LHRNQWPVWTIREFMCVRIAATTQLDYTRVGFWLCEYCAWAHPEADPIRHGKSQRTS